MMLLLQDEQVFSGTYSRRPRPQKGESESRAADVTAPPWGVWCGGGLAQVQGVMLPMTGPGPMEGPPRLPSWPRERSPSGPFYYLEEKGSGKKNWPGKWTELATWFNKPNPSSSMGQSSLPAVSSRGNPGQAWAWEQESPDPAMPPGSELQKRGPRSLEPAVVPFWPGRRTVGSFPSPREERGFQKWGLHFLH